MLWSHPLFSDFICYGYLRYMKEIEGETLPLETEEERVEKSCGGQGSEGRNAWCLLWPWYFVSYFFDLWFDDDVENLYVIFFFFFCWPCFCLCTLLCPFFLFGLLSMLLSCLEIFVDDMLSMMNPLGSENFCCLWMLLNVLLLKHFVLTSFPLLARWVCLRWWMFLFFWNLAS